ncbi:MAG: hypothetical protein CMK09_00195 [Ponticaulis sp.]|nr:hypothetical protein [Ponticaulis sp.]
MRGQGAECHFSAFHLHAGMGGFGQVIEAERALADFGLALHAANDFLSDKTAFFIVHAPEEVEVDV